ncbi:LPP20 family lipoprotein [Arcobacter porcinus]|uniref:LPP20 family lipoprotein n=1 Tax=Arcobacter porcinus TaxID=1935204 RepID=A0A5C2HCX8_9BACT|nr:LPP20 family lipoprotein [Arcobacter porcinus]OCL86599.1 hypothetical protein AAX30_01322 [Arcobacter porcinus]OCL96817.1 hypothetical protein AAX27_00451 [Aliarcobacter thereius]QEP40647.1 LPP20 family lipoprotein [Arcobacter porcinus]
MKKTIIYLIIALFLTSCSNNKPEPQALSYPNWYLNPTQNTLTTLYGVGEGRTLTEATNSALDNLSSRLLVTVQSNITITEKSYRDFREYATSTTNSEISSKTAELGFKNYKIDESIYFSGKNIVQVSIKKDDLIQTIKSDIEKLYSELDFVKKQQYDTLTLYLKEQELLSKFYNSSNKAQILDSLGYDIKFIQKTNSLRDEINSLKNRATFYISADNESSKYKNIFKDALLKRGFKVVNSIAPYELNLGSEISRKSPQGFYIYENILTITILDSSKHDIKSDIIELKGVSSRNYEDAGLNSIKELKELQEEENILPF